MALFEGKTPAERNKLIAAIALPLLAFIFVVRMLFFGSPAPTGQTNANNSNRRATPQGSPRPGTRPAPEENADDLLGVTRVIHMERAVYGGPDAGRNIFAYYVPPPPKPTPDPNAVVAPVETPTPEPPLVLASLAPQSVYAKTGNFTLQISGDKFTPASRLYIEGQEQPTQFKSPQQLVATVPATAIAFPGARNVVVRTPDGQLFSNPSTLNVMQPPAPTFTYIGLLKRGRPNADTAVLKDGKGELHSVRAGDLVEGRFRVTAINEKNVELVDKDLNIKHSMAFVEPRSTGATSGRAPGSIQPPPPPPSTDDNDEEP
ncbi:MAG TPA: IPT/TIG domain-containing protein [Pyrinomonadaceae bacterium]|nr:IPT/TIG domain-containing protein [Pyrinomonadaceae bacterium]